MHLRRVFQYARDAILVTQLERRHGPKEHLFILSHMRGYTSLLAHILGSHPDIHGYTESHLKLHSRRDLIRRSARIAREENGILPGRYLVDKILEGDAKRIRPKLLGEEKILSIFMLRKPLPTIRSIIEMGKYLGTTQFNEADALSYYVSRLAELSEIAIATNWQRPLFYLDAEQLIENTRPTLNRLRNFLDLRSELSENYAIFKHTGKAGYGDPSAIIASGKIQRPPSRGQEQGTVLSGNTQEIAQTAYETCRKILIQHSRQ